MKKVFLSFLSLITAFSFAGCAATRNNGANDPATGSDDDLQVGIVLPARDEPRWIQDEASFRSILEDEGFTSEVLFSQGSSAKELSNVESLIDRGMDVLVICAQDATAAFQAVETAHDAG